MQGYKAAWEAKDETMFCALFAADGVYRNTPFAAQRGHAEVVSGLLRKEVDERVLVQLGSDPTLAVTDGPYR